MTPLLGAPLDLTVRGVPEGMAGVGPNDEAYRSHGMDGRNYSIMRRGGPIGAAPRPRPNNLMVR